MRRDYQFSRFQWFSRISTRGFWPNSSSSKKNTAAASLPSSHLLLASTTVEPAAPSAQHSAPPPHVAVARVNASAVPLPFAAAPLNWLELSLGSSQHLKKSLPPAGLRPHTSAYQRPLILTFHELRCVFWWRRWPSCLPLPVPAPRFQQRLSLLRQRRYWPTS